MSNDQAPDPGGPYMLEIDPGVFPRLESLQISNYRVLRNVRVDGRSALGRGGTLTS